MTSESGASKRVGQRVRRAAWATLVAVALIASIISAGWYFLPTWAPAAANFFLPAQVSLSLQGRPGWHDGRLTLPGLSLYRSSCRWVSANDLSVRWFDGRWALRADAVSIDSRCAGADGVGAENAPEGGDNGAVATQGLRAETLGAALPYFTLNVTRLTVEPWQADTGSAELSHLPDGLHFRFSGQRLSLAADLQGRRLNVRQFTVRDDTLPAFQGARLSGEITLASELFSMPSQGQLQGVITLSDGTVLDAAFRFDSRQGALQVSDAQTGIILAHLPWRLVADDLVLSDGAWRWPYATQPLSGGISATLKDWRGGLDTLDITARVNALTQGLRGKANAVLNVGPGRLKQQGNALNFQFTGLANQGGLSLSASIPGQLRGELSDPTLALLPGSLLRITGLISEALNISSARLPLAGVTLTRRGLSGRLQAILQADAPGYGRAVLHMDGRAADFMPDQGEWRWRYWGGGDLAPFQARWNISGRGAWLADSIELTQLSCGLNQFKYGVAAVTSLRLALAAPLRWRRNAQHPVFDGALRMNARRIAISHGGYLDSPAMTLHIAGRTPDDFSWRGQLSSGPIGPIRLNGRWDGERLRGAAWWPTQSLRVFQTLLNPDVRITLHEGEFNAQSAFSAARGQGFLAGGHATVSHGGFWLGETRVKGMAVGLSYRLRDSVWQLGVKQPVSLNIDSITTPVALNTLSMGLEGYYPYSARRPLTLTGMAVNALGGNITLSPLSLPQRDAAMLRLKSIETSELITALKPKQFALSGRISGELPLHLDSPAGYVRHGWLAADSTMALRLDKQFADAIGGRNLATGAAVNWLRYMEITRLRADVNVSRQGDMDLLARFIGVNPQINAQREVRLNYRHQENLFMLWRSLRFGATVEQHLEKQAVAAPVATAREQK